MSAPHPLEIQPVFYVKDGQPRYAVLDHARLYLAENEATEPTRFERVTEAAIKRLPGYLQLRIRRGIVCQINTDDMPIKSRIPLESGYEQVTFTLGSFSEAFSLITLYQRSFETCFAEQNDFELATSVKDVIIHEMMHADGIGHEAMPPDQRL